MQDEGLIVEIIEDGRVKNKYHYVDYNNLYWMINQMKFDHKRKKMLFTPKMFITPLSILILQKWQREGKIDIGIKC